MATVRTGRIGPPRPKEIDMTTPTGKTNSPTAARLGLAMLVMGIILIIGDIVVPLHIT